MEKNEQIDNNSSEFSSDFRTTALALYTPPFHYAYGYIWDAKENMVADNHGQDVALRVRGWGRIGYQPNAEQLQDTVGELMAEALTKFWSQL